MKSKWLTIAAAVTLGIGAAAAVQAPAAAATTVKGQVTCVGNDNVVGVWIKAENGGSGWASWSAPLVSWVANYSYSLPNGGRYQVHVGCGGTPQNWATNNKSGYVSGTNNSFTCYPVLNAGPMYLKCQLT
jgi:hypothetical protein